MMFDVLNFITLVLLLVLLAYWSLGIKGRLRHLEERTCKLHSHVWDTALLVRMLPSDVMPPVPTDWSASSDLIFTLVKLVRADRPTKIVELGSGFSTIVLAAELKAQGHGKVIAIDHDHRFGSQTEAALEASGLSEWAEVRIAPLQRQKILEDSTYWYDCTTMKDLQNIDLLFVDGPPGDLAPGIRGAALPYFWSRLSLRAKVVFDDASRQPENAFVSEWEKSVKGCSVEWLPLKKGCAVLQKLDQA